jgi:hypothetical protein
MSKKLEDSFTFFSKHSSNLCPLLLVLLLWKKSVCYLDSLFCHGQQVFVSDFLFPPHTIGYLNYDNPNAPWSLLNRVYKFLLDDVL